MFPTPVDHVPLRIGRLYFQLDQSFLRDRRRIRMSETTSACRRPNRKLEGKDVGGDERSRDRVPKFKGWTLPDSEDKRTFRKLEAESSGRERGGARNGRNGRDGMAKGRTSFPSHERVHKRGEVITPVRYSGIMCVYFGIFDFSICQLSVCKVFSSVLSGMEYFKKSAFCFFSLVISVLLALISFWTISSMY